MKLEEITLVLKKINEGMKYHNKALSVMFETLKDLEDRVEKLERDSHYR